MNKEYEINEGEVVDYLRLTGQFKPALHEVLRRKVAVQVAQEKGIKITPEELQQAADNFRVCEELHEASETNRWLSETGITLEALEEYLTANLLINKLKDGLEKDIVNTQVLSSEPLRTVVRETAFHNFIESRV